MAVIIGIVVLICALVALAIWAFRKNKAMGAEADQALAALAQELGTTYAPGQAITITGAIQGRACALSQQALRATQDQSDVDYYVTIGLAIRTSTTLDLAPRISRLGTPRGGGVTTGSPEIDKDLVIDTNDVGKVARALGSDAGRAFADWSRTGWLNRVWIEGGQLHYEGGRGLIRKADIEKTGGILKALARFAADIE